MAKKVKSFFSKAEPQPDMAQQIAAIAEQVKSLKEKLAESEKIREELESKYKISTKENTQKSLSEETLKKSIFELQRKIKELEEEASTNQKELENADSKYFLAQEEKERIIKNFELKLSESNSKILSLTKEKAEIKGEVAGALSELNEQFAKKTELLQDQLQLTEQKRQEYEAYEKKQIEEANEIKSAAQIQAYEIIEEARKKASQMMTEAQDKVATREEEAKKELHHLKERIDYYSTKITEAAQTIDHLLNSVSQL